MGNYRLGIYEKAMPDGMTLEEKLLLAKQTGFDYVELSIDETEEKIARLDFPKKRLEELHQFMLENNIFMETMCLSAHRKYPLGSEKEEIRRKSLEIMKKAIIFSRDLGIRIIQLAGYDVYYEKSNAATRENFTRELKKCAEYAAEFGIILAFETMETEFMNTIRKAKAVVEVMESPYLQIYPDIGNIRNATEHYQEDILAGRGKIVAVHLKETRENVFRDMEYGEGRVDFKGCINRLVSQGVFRFTCEFWYDKKTCPELYLRRNREYIRRCLPE